MSEARRPLWRAKLKAFGLHFSISLGLFAAIIAATLELWYPPPYFWIDGGWFVVRLAAIVDIILGPLLTLIIFKPGKRLLALNLAVIAMVQSGFLVWGVNVLYQQRPLFAAYVGKPSERFFPVTKGLAQDGLRPLDEVLALSSERPAIIAVRLPEDPAKARELLLAGLTGKASVLRRTELFEPLAGAHLESLVAAGRSRTRIAEVWPIASANVDRFLAERGGRFEDYAFVPMQGRYYIALLAFEHRTGRYAGALYTHDRLATLYGY
ncbi:MAG: hypothetical protein ACREUO_01665 [Burkholderiales bacterium]